MKGVNVKRSNLVLYPDRSRVLMRPFHPTNMQRAARICAHVMALPEKEVLTEARERFKTLDPRQSQIQKQH